MTTTTATPAGSAEMMATGLSPLLKTAATLSCANGAFWAFLFCRWLTFGVIAWRPLAAELALAQWPPILAYLVYGLFAVINVLVGVGILRGYGWAGRLGLGGAGLALTLGVTYFLITREFFGAAVVIGVAGMLLILLRGNAPWSLAYPAAFWLAIFFVIPMIIVLMVSFGERSRLGTVVYPALNLRNPGIYLNDYVRFFGRINGELLYLRIFWRSVWIASLNTLLCLIIAYPFAYWIARRPKSYRGPLIFLVMIPFWTNFLVRTYAWMLILRDSGLINNFWTITLHDQAVLLAGHSQLFVWLAAVTERKLPLLFNQPAVMLGLLYGFLPFMILPLYSNLEKIDWSLLEAAADLGAGTWQSVTRILIPLTMPGIVAGSIIVFIPSLGAYVTPDLLGGAKVALLGNLLQQQFMTVRDWPFGAAIGFIMMAIMLVATLLYFRTLNRDEALGR